MRTDPTLFRPLALVALAALSLPVVAQDATTKQVLMVAWANEEALRHTAETGEGCYWSRSRKELWIKGKTSGKGVKGQKGVEF